MAEYKYRTLMCKYAEGFTISDRPQISERRKDDSMKKNSFFIEVYLSPNNGDTSIPRPYLTKASDDTGDNFALGDGPFWLLVDKCESEVEFVNDYKPIEAIPHYWCDHYGFLKDEEWLDVPLAAEPYFEYPNEIEDVIYTYDIHPKSGIIRNTKKLDG